MSENNELYAEIKDESDAGWGSDEFPEEDEPKSYPKKPSPQIESQRKIPPKVMPKPKINETKVETKIVNKDITVNCGTSSKNVSRTWRSGSSDLEAKHIQYDRQQLINFTPNITDELKSKFKSNSKQTQFKYASSQRCDTNTNTAIDKLDNLESIKVKPNIVETVTALYDYTGQDVTQLSFDTQDIIIVLEKEDHNWWTGQVVRTGETGLFPTNYVKPNPKPKPKPSAYLSRTLSHSQSVANLSAGSHSPMRPWEITHNENERQRHIKELIDTEEYYVRDLEITNEVFMRPLYAANCLTDVEIGDIFLNLPELAQLNHQFLRSLIGRRRDACERDAHQVIWQIGDILCHYLARMPHTYNTFLSRQLSAAQLIQRKTETDPNFVSATKQCSREPSVNGLGLSNYLIKPMQRITRYKLMIEKILECTPENHVDYANSERALKLSVELCDRANELTQASVNADQLEWCQRHIQLRALDYALVFNSDTNCLGTRKLIHNGPLIKSTQSLFAFLFTDFLLLTVPNKGVEGINNVFTSDKAKEVLYSMYAPPILLDDIQTRAMLPIECQYGFHIQIRSTGKALVLKGNTEAERSTWLKAIDKASAHFGHVRKSMENTVIDTSLKLHNKKTLSLNVLTGVHLNRRRSVINMYCEFGVHCDQRYTTKTVRCSVKALNRSTAPILGKLLPMLSSKNVNKRRSVALPSTSAVEQPTNHNYFQIAWNEWISLPISAVIGEQMLTIKCLDRNPYARHELLGSCVVPLSDLIREMNDSCELFGREFQLSSVDKDVLFGSVTANLCVS